MNTDPLIREFVAAVNDSDLERLRRLFMEHAELKEHVNDQVFSFDRSAVHLCRENLPMIDLLVSHGADLNLKSAWWAGGFGILEGLSIEQAQPLIDRGAIVDIWAAVGLIDFECVRRLLAEDPSLVRARGGDGKHPLHYANDVGMVDLLVDAGADLNARCVDHESKPIQYLVKNESVVDRMIELGAVPDVFLAAFRGKLDWLEMCLRSDSNCCNVRLGVGGWASRVGGHIYNWTLGHDLTPQQVARQQGHSAALKRLLENASPQRQLMDAIWHHETDIVARLLEEHPDLRERLGLDDQQCMARAAWWYNPKAVQLMLELGFDPHIAGVHRSTPLDRAAFHGYSDIIRVLLKHDDQPPLETKNEFGGTPLGACLHGFRFGWETGNPQDHVESVRLLVEAGASVENYSEGIGDAKIDAILKNGNSSDG